LRGRVEEALADTPVIMIAGPRQAGKSTLAEEFAGKGRRYVTLDDPIALSEAKRDPGAFLDANGAPLIIDEVQRAPEILLPIKLRVDRNRTPGSYLLTGSANVLALPKVADSLAGRMEVIDLLPLTQGEMEGTEGNFVDAIFRPEYEPDEAWAKEEPILDRCRRGGFPEPALRSNPRRRRPWFESYFRTLLERDVRDLANIEGLTQMPRLLTLLATRNGSALNVSALARDTGIPATTLTRYLDLLRLLFLIQLVPTWSADTDTRLLKSPKAFLVDTGLACHLAHLDDGSLGADSPLTRPMVEGFVANELARLITQSEVQPWLMHLRTVRMKEVDFVLESRDRRVVGIDVKFAASVQPSDFSGLRYLADLAGNRFQRGVLLYDGKETVRVGPTLMALPFGALWRGN